IAKADYTVTVHHLAVAPAAAGAVRIVSSVVIHIFGLTDLTVHTDVIHLHITVTAVVDVLNVDVTGGCAAVDIILIAGGQGPALNTGTTDSEYDLLRSGSAARADCNAAAIRASAAGGGRIISGAVAAGIAVALAD